MWGRGVVGVVVFAVVVVGLGAVGDEDYNHVRGDMR